jgi:hypothetical protein
LSSGERSCEAVCLKLKVLANSESDELDTPEMQTGQRFE